MRHSERRWVAWLMGAAMVIPAGCRRSEPVPPPIPVQVATLRPEPIAMETRFSATVRERHRIELSFKVSGTVAALVQVPGPDGKPRDVHEGDTVISGPNSYLAQLDVADYRRRVEAIQDRLAQAQAKERASLAAVTAVRATFKRIRSLRDLGIGFAADV
jgi:multidrug efflux pump subunit AcrA (membrane-fusion protein)